MYQICGNNVMV